MRLHKWKCDRQGPNCEDEFEYRAHHHYELDFCNTCHTEVELKRKLYKEDIDDVRENTLQQITTR